MERCPYSKKGKHALSVIVPETSDEPATLFCEVCGMTKTVALTFPVPADDLVAEAERILRG